MQVFFFSLLGSAVAVELLSRNFPGYNGFPTPPQPPYSPLPMAPPMAPMQSVPAGRRTPVQTLEFSDAKNGPYPCSVLLKAHTQKIMFVSPFTVNFGAFIGSLENPGRDADKVARIALEALDFTPDETFTLEEWNPAIYTCTLKAPPQIPGGVPSLARDGDSILQRIVRLGMASTFEALLKKSPYDVGHYFWSRDRENNNLIHLAAMANSVAVLQSLTVVLEQYVVPLMDERNAAGDTPLDIANRHLYFSLAEALKRHYTVFKLAGPVTPPDKPPYYRMPTVKLLVAPGTNPLAPETPPHGLLPAPQPVRPHPPAGAAPAAPFATPAGIVPGATPPAEGLPAGAVPPPGSLPPAPPRSVPAAPVVSQPPMRTRTQDTDITEGQSVASLVNSAPPSRPVGPAKPKKFRYDHAVPHRRTSRKGVAWVVLTCVVVLGAATGTLVYCLRGKL